MSQWNKLAPKESVEKASAALAKHNINAHFVKTGEEAKATVLEIIPPGAEVMTMTSVTLDTIGLTQELNESGQYDSIKHKLSSMSRDTQSRDMQRLGAAPEWAIGSVHAVTEDGNVLIASNTGSQLPAYVYGSDHVVWVVGTQKIVKNTEEGIKRIYEYTLPLESERAKKAYGVPGSAVNKLLIINHEVKPDRLTIVFVNQVLGF